jgi:hypothetical protein
MAVRQRAAMAARALTGRTAQDFRRASAVTVCRVLGGEWQRLKHEMPHCSRTFDAELSSTSDWSTQHTCRPATGLLRVLAGTAEGCEGAERSGPDVGAG